MEALLAVMTPAEEAAQLGSCWADDRDSDQIIAPTQDVLSAGRAGYRTVVAPERAPDPGLRRRAGERGAGDGHPGRGAAGAAAGDRLGIPAIAQAGTGRSSPETWCSVADLAGSAAAVLEGPVRTVGADPVLHTDVPVRPGS